MSSLEEELETPYPSLHEEINDQPCMSLSEVQNTQDMQVTFDTTAGAVTQLMRGILKDMRATGVTIPAAASVHTIEPQQLGPVSPTCQPRTGDGGTSTNHNVGLMMRKSCLSSSSSGASPDLWPSQFTGVNTKEPQHLGMMMRKPCLPSSPSGASPDLWPSQFTGVNTKEPQHLGMMMRKPCLPSSPSGASPDLSLIHI